MATSSAVVRTENASRYLQQLCKHFAHRIEVEFTPTHGVCRFSVGTATLDADAGQLTIVAEARDDTALGETQHVIESHLLRFAFREELGPLAWTKG